MILDNPRRFLVTAISSALLLLLVATTGDERHALAGLEAFHKSTTFRFDSSILSPCACITHPTTRGYCRPTTDGCLYFDSFKSRRMTYTQLLRLFSHTSEYRRSGLFCLFPFFFVVFAERYAGHKLFLSTCFFCHGTTVRVQPCTARFYWRFGQVTACCPL